MQSTDGAERSVKMLRLLAVTAVAIAITLTPAAATTSGHLTFDSPYDPEIIDAWVDSRPRFGPPTTQVKVHGKGFWAHERIEVFISEEMVARSKTNAAGKFKTEFLVPSDADIGAESLTVVGLSSGRFAQSPFEIVSVNRGHDGRKRPSFG